MDAQDRRNSEQNGSCQADPTRDADAKAPASILIVSAGTDDREMYAEFLRMRGFHVNVTDDVADAMSLARSAALIVTELRLRQPVDALTLIRRVREDHQTKTTPIIVLTASAFGEDQRRAETAGCDVFLTKPCLPDALAGQVIRLLVTEQ